MFNDDGDDYYDYDDDDEDNVDSESLHSFRNSPIASNILKLLLVFPFSSSKCQEFYLDFGHENHTPNIF